MSTCPEFDLYSVYLDHEMPESLKNDFTEHLEKCPECSRHFSRFKNIQTALRSNSQTITLSKAQTEESFKKLCIVMNYKAVTKKAHPDLLIKTLKIVSPALAAVMVFAFILPLRLLHSPDVQHNFLTPNTNASASLINNRGIIVDNSLSAVLSNSRSFQQISSLDFSNSSISSIDIFKPALSNDSITIQIKLSGIHDILPKTSSGLYEAAFAGGSGAQF